MLAYTSLQFEELKLRIPMLSCYESEETKLEYPSGCRGELWLVDIGSFIQDELYLADHAIL